MPYTPQTPFDLTPAKMQGFDSYDDLARWLTDEINGAMDARPETESQLDYWHRLYEQARTRLETNRPTPNGADLTTPLATQFVDSLHARTMQTLFVEPIWTVEGWGEDGAKRAPYVEEFHQWAAEDERVQNYVDRAIQNSWIDSEGILECFEEIDYRPIRKRIWAKVRTYTDEMGQPRALFTENNEPAFERDPRGDFVEVPAPPDGAEFMDASVAQIEIDSYEPVRLGPGYSVVDLTNFWVLPGHATERKDVWGYVKRFYRRVPYLKQKVEDGLFDKEAVDEIGGENERETTLEDDRIGRVVASQEEQTAEKELFEIAFLLDLDGKGERWWQAVLSTKYEKLLRLKYDDLGTQLGFGRFVRFVPFPRKNSVGGLSLVGHKLITLLEEHTAVRNMRADLAALHASAPMKVHVNALWDPDETPIGPGVPIWVRDMNEIQPMAMPDLSAPLNVWESSIFDAAQRTMGINEIATGIQPEEKRTLGEVKLTAGYSEVRVNLVTKRLQEAMEELGQIRHVIWKRVVAERGEMDIPTSAMAGLEARGQDVQALPGGKVTLQLLEGKFKFKPRGSVETADLGRQRQDFVQMMQMMPALQQVNPMIGAMLQTPDAAKAFMEHVLKLFRFSDRQAILGPAGQQGLQQAVQARQMAQQMAQMQAMGGPPMGGAPGVPGPPRPPMGGPPQGGPPAPPPMGQGVAA